MMGFFAAYNGFIYNEVFAIPLEIFGSCYTSYSYPINWKDPDAFDAYHRKYDDCVYDIGLDPRWAQTSNDLTNLNSFKQKLAVILGVSQMTLGIIMKGFNNVYFGQWIDLFFETFP